MKPFTVAMWAEEFHGLAGFNTFSEARAFADGWGAGGGQYGAGKCCAYVFPEDIFDMDDDDIDEARSAMAYEVNHQDEEK